MEIGVYKSLIRKVHIISERSKEISRLKGENFNIFKVLNAEYNEVTTHNRFIAELLNPHGSHDQGNRFLELFIDYLLNNIPLSEDKQEIIRNIRESEATVQAEYWLGPKDDKNKSGGSVDICIHTPKGQIRIENKIHAGEQDNQIARYCFNHKRENNVVFYLTLNGKEASSAGQFEEGQDYYLLAHEDNMLNWLEACHNEAADHPILRETLKQYIILIRKLTGQTTSKKMDKEIEELILKDATHFEAVKQLTTSYQRAIDSEYKRILDYFDAKLEEDHDLTLERVRSGRSDGGFIRLKSLEVEGAKYDLGINVELDNNYCFFCMIKEETNRNPSINNNKQFNEIAQSLESISKNFNFSGSRNGYSLTGKYIFKNKFHFESYLNSERDKTIIDRIYAEVDQLIYTIRETKV